MHPPNITKKLPRNIEKRINVIIKQRDLQQYFTSNLSCPIKKLRMYHVCTDEIYRQITTAFIVVFDTNMADSSDTS
jgi:hypothetical protein